MVEEGARLQELLDWGITPFGQMYRADPPIEYSPEWKAFERKWSRPAAMKAKKRR